MLCRRELAGLVEDARRSEAASRQLQKRAAEDEVFSRDLAAHLANCPQWAFRKHFHHVLISLLDGGSNDDLVQEIFGGPKAADIEFLKQLACHRYGCRVAVAALRRCGRGCPWAQSLLLVVLDMAPRLARSSMGIFVVQRAVWEARGKEAAKRASVFCDLVPACWITSPKMGLLEVLVESDVPGVAARILETESLRLFRCPMCDSLARLLFARDLLPKAFLLRPRAAEVLAEPLLTFADRAPRRRAPSPAQAGPSEPDAEPESGGGCGPVLAEPPRKEAEDRSEAPPPSEEPDREAAETSSSAGTGRDEVLERASASRAAPPSSAPLPNGARAVVTPWERTLPLSTTAERSRIVWSLKGRLRRYLRTYGVGLLERLMLNTTALQEELCPLWPEVQVMLPLLARFRRGRCALEVLARRTCSLTEAAAAALQQDLDGDSAAAPKDGDDGVADEGAWRHLGSACVPIVCNYEDGCVLFTGAHVSSPCFLRSNSEELEGDETSHWAVEQSPLGPQWSLFWTAPARIRWALRPRHVRRLRDGKAATSLPVAACGRSFVVSLLWADASKVGQGEIVRVFVAVRLLEATPDDVFELRLRGQHDPVRCHFGTQEVCVVGSRYVWLTMPGEVVVAICDAES